MSHDPTINGTVGNFGLPELDQEQATEQRYRYYVALCEYIAKVPQTTRTIDKTHALLIERDGLRSEFSEREKQVR